jgi:hypothetical protein
VAGTLSPAGAHAAKTDLNINFDEFDLYFFGQAFSDDSGCMNDRKVTLYRKKAGEDAKLGTDKTEIDIVWGYWEIKPAQVKSPANYYAKVKKKGKCKADKSETEKLDPNAPRRRANTNLTINESGGNFFGQAKSSKRSCENGRTVKLYLKRPGTDEKVGSDKTGPGKGDSEGVWVISPSKIAVGGKYYAKVKAKGDCEGDKSKAIVPDI